MTNPYPLPRYIRQTEILVGDGGSGYGPFDGFLIFDVEDVEVWARAQDDLRFAPIDAVVQKVSGLPFDFFTIEVDGGIAATTEFVVLSARLHERSAGVMNGTRIDPSALEKELSKQGTVLQEMRRDIGRVVRVEFGADTLVIDGNLVDGDTLMLQGDRLIKGPNASQIAAAQGYALAVATMLEEAEQLATPADGTVGDDKLATGSKVKLISENATAFGAGLASAADAAAARLLIGVDEGGPPAAYDDVSIALLAEGLADARNSWLSMNKVFADSFDTLEMVDAAGATGLSTATAGLLKPSVSPGADLATSAQAISGGDFSTSPSHVKGNAFDNSGGSVWISQQVGAGVNGVAWIGQDFGAGNAKDITSVSFLQNFNANNSVTSIVIQYSDNASAWTTVLTQAVVFEAVTRTFTFPSAGAHRYWRIRANTGIADPSVGWCVNEITFSEGAPANVTARSEVFPVAEQPEQMKIVALVRPLMALAIGTDLKFDVSRDNGAHWSEATLSVLYTMGDVSIVEGAFVDVSGHDAVNEPSWRLRSFNNKNFELLGLAVCL